MDENLNFKTKENILPKIYLGIKIFRNGVYIIKQLLIQKKNVNFEKAQNVQES